MAASHPVALLDRPQDVRMALSPVRRRLLARLRQPASATELSAEFGLGRQRLNYHLRTLERAGLLSLVETRRKRGCVERVLIANARAFVVDPDVVAGPQATARDRQDRYSADHLVGAAAAIVRDVTRMQVRAAEKQQRLLTFTIETDVRFERPEDLQAFSTALAEAVTLTAARFASPAAGRRYRVVVGAHPAPVVAAQKERT